jgi:hypothetical protein
MMKVAVKVVIALQDFLPEEAAELMSPLQESKRNVQKNKSE